MLLKRDKEIIKNIMYMINHYEALTAFTREMDRFIKKYIQQHPDWRDKRKSNKTRKP